VLPRDTVRLALERSTSIVRMHYQPGQSIIRQGDAGSRFYVIAHGEVDVVRLDRDGGELHLATLGPGEHFGEIVLMRGGRRNATVRARTAVDVLAMERGDFLALAAVGPFFRERMELKLRERLTEDEAAASLATSPGADESPLR